MKTIYIVSETYGCYKMEIPLPHKFHNVDMKKDNEYIKWKNEQDKLLDDRIVEYENNKWWNTLDDKTREDLLKKYGSSDMAKKRKVRFTCNMDKCTNYKTIDDSFFS